MRLNFRLSPNTELIPFNYQQLLIGAFHKWLGKNKIHDEISLYSLSWLKGGDITKEGFNFPNGAEWFISFWDNNIGKKLVEGITKDPFLFNGLSVTEIVIQEDPSFSNYEKFYVASPVLIRKYDENKKAEHLTFRNDEAGKYLTDSLKKKMVKAGLDHEVSVSFDKDYSDAKTKMVVINDIYNRASFCPVIISGDPEAILFAWNVGIGHSTGCCFGALN